MCLLLITQWFVANNYIAKCNSVKLNAILQLHYTTRFCLPQEFDSRLLLSVAFSPESHHSAAQEAATRKWRGGGEKRKERRHTVDENTEVGLRRRFGTVARAHVVQCLSRSVDSSVVAHTIQIRSSGCG